MPWNKPKFVILVVALATVVISGLLTAARMYQGGQLMPEVPRSTATTKEPPPRFVLDGVTMVGNVIEIKAPDSPLGKRSRIHVRFRNDGEGPLRIKLLRTNCNCVHDFLVDGDKLELNGASHVTPPGESGVITLEWLPEELDPEHPISIVAAEFMVNDPRPRFHSHVRLEVRTRVVASKEGSE